MIVRPINKTSYLIIQQGEEFDHWRSRRRAQKQNINCSILCMLTRSPDEHCTERTLN